MLASGWRALRLRPEDVRTAARLPHHVGLRGAHRRPLLGLPGLHERPSTSSSPSSPTASPTRWTPPVKLLAGWIMSEYTAPCWSAVCWRAAQWESWWRAVGVLVEGYGSPLGGLWGVLMEGCRNPDGGGLRESWWDEGCGESCWRGYGSPVGGGLGVLLEECGSPVGGPWESCWRSVGVLLEECGSPVGGVWESCWRVVGALLEGCRNLLDSVGVLVEGCES